jgi:hypothetical protein
MEQVYSVVTTTTNAQAVRSQRNNFIGGSSNMPSQNNSPDKLIYQAN